MLKDGGGWGLPPRTRFRHFTTACLLGYMGFFLFALNLLFTQRGTQTMLVPLLAVCCSTWSAAVLGEGQGPTHHSHTLPPSTHVIAVRERHRRSL